MTLTEALGEERIQEAVRNISGATAYGFPVGEMSREELLAVLWHEHKRQQSMPHQQALDFLLPRKGG